MVQEYIILRNPRDIIKEIYTKGFTIVKTNSCHLSIEVT